MHLEQVAARPHIGLVSEMTYNVSSETLNTTIHCTSQYIPHITLAERLRCCDGQQAITTGFRGGAPIGAGGS